MCINLLHIHRSANKTHAQTHALRVEEMKRRATKNLDFISDHRTPAAADRRSSNATSFADDNEIAAQIAFSRQFSMSIEPRL